MSIILLIIFSVAAHEWGHVYAAKKLGWEFKGVAFKFYGPAMKIDPKDKLDQLWKIASAGLLVTLFLSIGFYILSPISGIFTFMAYLNLFMFFINIIPIKPTDGWQILSCFRGKDTRIKI